MKKQRLRDKTLADIAKSKQVTFDKLPEPKAAQPKPSVEKSIEIAQLEYSAKEDELEFTVAFRLLPSKNAFSSLTLELHFDENKLNTYVISIPPSKLLNDEFEFPIALDMKGICPGPHTVKVEIYERWDTGEKLTSASKYVIVEHSPTRKQDRYIKVPIVKRIDGAFKIIMPEEQEFYEQLEKKRREEQSSMREHW